MKNHSRIYLFVVIVLLASLKHVGLFVYGYFKYNVWYWADSALRAFPAPAREATEATG